MRTLNIISLILLAVGGINWGLVGLFNVNLVSAIFNEGSVLSAFIYTLIGLSAIWQLFSFRWMIDHETEYSTDRIRHA